MLCYQMEHFRDCCKGELHSQRFPYLLDRNLFPSWDKIYTSKKVHTYFRRETKREDITRSCDTKNNLCMYKLIQWNIVSIQCVVIVWILPKQYIVTKPGVYIVLDMLPMMFMSNVLSEEIHPFVGMFDERVITTYGCLWCKYWERWDSPRGMWKHCRTQVPISGFNSNMKSVLHWGLELISQNWHGIIQSL